MVNKLQDAAQVFTHEFTCQNIDQSVTKVKAHAKNIYCSQFLS